MLKGRKWDEQRQIAEIKRCIGDNGSVFKQNNLPNLDQDKNSNIKGTVSVISSDPPCKDSSIQFTTVPLKSLSDQTCLFISVNFSIVSYKQVMRKSLLQRNQK